MDLAITTRCFFFFFRVSWIIDFSVNTTWRVLNRRCQVKVCNPRDNLTITDDLESPFKLLFAEYFDRIRLLCYFYFAWGKVIVPGHMCFLKPEDFLIWSPFSCLWKWKRWDCNANQICLVWLATSEFVLAGSKKTLSTVIGQLSWSWAWPVMISQGRQRSSSCLLIFSLLKDIGVKSHFPFLHKALIGSIFES